MNIGIIDIFLSIILLSSCGGQDRTSGNSSTDQSQSFQAKAGRCRITNPQANQRFTIGDDINIEVEPVDEQPVIDSVVFYAGGNIICTSYGPRFTCSWNSGRARTGENSLKAVTHYNNQTTSTCYVSVILLSDVEPANIAYKVVNTYPHDIGAYTQGLIFEDGYLYEGTGQYNESSLRKVDINTGEALKLLNLPGDIFGEGITIFRNKIYQLTYKSQIGFVYDKETFNRLQQVYYQNKEGWGLTHDSTRLIMSDGSHVIYFMDPEYFTEVGRIEVYNPQGPVSRLNELEYIQGKIFANIYGLDEIVIIDPITGKVTGRLNCKGILPEKDKHRKIDVFNGIAWDQYRQRLYVTGKNWPRMFEIELLSDF